MAKLFCLGELMSAKSEEGHEEEALTHWQEMVKMKNFMKEKPKEKL